MNVLSLLAKFRLTALQIAAIVIIPLFFLALYAKIKDRFESKSVEVATTRKYFHQSEKLPK